MKIESLTDAAKIPNEDQYLITPKNSPYLFGIFDGQTGLVKYFDSAGNTGGFLASKIVKDEFEANPDKPLLESMSKALKILKNKMLAAGINQEDKSGFWGTSASVVRIDKNSNLLEYLNIGDSPIVIVEKDNSFKTYYVDHDLETTTLWKKLADKGVKEIRQDPRMQVQLIKNRRESNIKYGILNGEEEAIKFVKTGTIPLEKIKYILIFSDGMLIPKTNPNHPEDFRTIIKLFEEGGLINVKNYIRSLEASDPNCVKYLRFKPQDDLTSIAIIF